MEIIRPARRVFERGRRAYSVLAERRCTTIAGTLVFFLITSLVPFLFWVTLLFGSYAAGGELAAELGLFGWAEELLVYLQKNAAESTAGVNVFLLATTLWSVTGFFYHLRRSGEILYRYSRNARGWKVRLSALLFTLCILLFFALAATVLFSAALLTRGLPFLLSRFIVYTLVLIVGFFGAWLLNVYVCPYRCRPSDTVLGSLCTAIAWLAASLAFSVYVSFGGREKLYGAFTLVIVFLLWLYWMMICFTAGVVLNSRRMDTRSLPHRSF